MPLKDYSVIVGLGKTGLSCAYFLSQQGRSILVMDSRESPPGLDDFYKNFPTIALHLGSLDEALLLQAEEIILSPGVSPAEPAFQKAREQGIPLIGDIELFARAVRAPVVGITGTNAKGTVTTLIGEMIKNAGHRVLVGGNIGTPALDLLALPVPDYYVLELSSFQLETTHSLHLQAATLLNISEDHLDRHGDMSAYLAAKQRIYQNCKVCVWNREDKKTYPSLNAMNADYDRKCISFGLTEPAEDEFGLQVVNNQSWLAHGKQLLLSVDELQVKGRHNWSNALAALALGQALDLPLVAMQTALRTFTGLHHRCEKVIEHNGVTWYDDSKGTNVGATLAAIYGLGSALKGKLILIAGGLGKGADFNPLQDPVSKYVRSVILIGKDAMLLDQVLRPVVPIKHAKNMEEAVVFASKAAQANDAVLLSPACASLDMFRDYEQRGEIFQSLVKEITT